VPFGDTISTSRVISKPNYLLYNREMALRIQALFRLSARRGIIFGVINHIYIFSNFCIHVAFGAPVAKASAKSGTVDLSHGVDANGKFDESFCCGHCMKVDDDEWFTIRTPKNQSNKPNFKFVEQNNTMELVDIANKDGNSEDFIVTKGRIPRIEFTLEWLMSRPAPVHQFDEPPVCIDNLYICLYNFLAVQIIVEIEHLANLKQPEH
jgi:hypothetical protein